MPKNSNKPWSHNEDDLLEMKAAGGSNGAIGAALDEARERLLAVSASSPQYEDRAVKARAPPREIARLNEEEARNDAS